MIERTTRTGATQSTPLRIAMALYSDLDHDSRVLREATSLAEVGHDVTIYCLSWGGPVDTPFRVVAHMPGRTGVVPDASNPFHQREDRSRIGRAGRRLVWMRDYIRNLRTWGRWVTDTAGDVDVWHAHDLPALMAVGPRVAPAGSIVYDSHEIFLDTGTAIRMPWLVRRLLARYERRLVRRTSALITVNEAYADVLRRRVHPRRLVIVRNCPPRWTPTEGSRSRLRTAAGIPPESPVVLYHGALGPNRGIEQLVEALAEPGMGNVHLALLGFGDVRRLGVDVGDPATGGRVHTIAAVSPDELLEWVAGADVDAMPLQPSTLNHRLCTPNKLWESLAAGVPVLVSDFPVMRGIVLDVPSEPLGVVCEPSEPASIAAAIRTIVEAPPEARSRLRDRCLAVAHDRWNWEAESARLIELYGSIRAIPWPDTGSG